MVTPNHTPDWAGAEAVVREVAYSLARSLPPEATMRVPLGGEPSTPGHVAHTYGAVNPAHVDKLADIVQAFVAELVATLVDAGSERDCIMEAEALHEVLVKELVQWCPDPSDLPGGPPHLGTGA